jgi:hypothetical protein
MENDTSTERIARLIESIEEDVRTLRQLVLGDQPVPPADSAYFSPQEEGEDTAIEGIFDGERMVDYAGKSYQVSPNYASKSKLVEGDPLKLYITHDGKFYYKQLGPVPRKTVPGVLRTEGSHYVVDAEDGNTYSVLTASVTYYMSLYSLRPGGKVMLMIPADQPARWAVIDNIL